MSELKAVKLACLTTKVRALIIRKNGNYQITSCVVVMARTSDGSYRSLYPDFFDCNNVRYYLKRIDRKNNTVVFEEGHRLEEQLST